MTKSKKALVPKEVSKALDKIAKGVGVAVTELWTIFVRQYFVRGITLAFVGSVLCIASFFLQPAIGLFILAPLAAALGFFYRAILLLGNPKYYALEDIQKRIQKFKSGEAEPKTKPSPYRYY